MLPYSEEDLFQRSKLDVEELVTRDEAEYGTYLDASQLTKLLSCATERREERLTRVHDHPHNQCQQFLKDIRAEKCNLFEGLVLKQYRKQEHVVQVQVLRVCRQVYIEANPVLWSSNTLAFNKPYEFGWFMSDRIAAQKASITSLLLDLSQYSEYLVVTNGIINALVGLRSLYLHLADGVHPAWRGPGHVVNVGEDIEDWRIRIKDRETRDGFSSFKRLPLEKVTVLMMDPRNGYAFTPQWRRSERAKYAETVREAILHPEGPQIYQQESADAKAKLEAEETRRRNVRRPCPNASTPEECASLKQDILDGQKVRQGKAKSAKPKAQACKDHHVCLICYSVLRLTREQAKQCIKPGECEKEYFGVMFRDARFPSRSFKIFVKLDETIETIRDRYRGSPSIPWKCYRLQLIGITLEHESTVEEAGLDKDTEKEIMVINPMGRAARRLAAKAEKAAKAAMAAKGPDAEEKYESDDYDESDGSDDEFSE
jgi:hypothetical protein